MGFNEWKGPWTGMRWQKTFQRAEIVASPGKSRKEQTTRACERGGGSRMLRLQVRNQALARARVPSVLRTRFARGEVPSTCVLLHLRGA